MTFSLVYFSEDNYHKCKKTKEKSDQSTHKEIKIFNYNTMFTQFKLKIMIFKHYHCKILITC